VFGELQAALNVMWDAPPPKVGLGVLIRARFLAFAMVLVIGFLLLVSLVISAVLAGIEGHFTGLFHAAVVGQIVNFVISLGVVTTLFALIYKVLPDVSVAWRDVAVGAFVTALLFTLGKLVIGLYLGNSSLASAYGAAGSLAVMLVWIYYSALLILFGAEFTQVFARRHDPKPPAPVVG
jgi:membrane protein